MNRGKNILKKTTAAVLSSSMILTGASTVFAAGSYQETARTSLDALVSSITAMTDDYAKSMDKAFAGSNGKMTLTVEDTGKVVLGSLLGQQDMTWLQDLTMDMKVSVKDGTEAINSTILLNGEKLCDLNVYEDLSEMKQYIQIPEVSDAYLSVDPAGSADETTQEFMQGYMNALSDITSVMPDTETISTLFDRYGNLVIGNMEEGTETEESVSVEGISEDCTVYEGIVTGDSARSMMEEILTTAKDDKEIKGLFDLWNQGEDQYASYQSGIDDLLNDLKSAEAEDSESTSFSEKLWVNSEDKVVGREFGINDGTDYQPVFTLKTPSEDGQTALLLEFGADDSYITLTGTGSSTDGLWNGDYILAVDHTEAMDIGVTDLELKPEKVGYYNGTFTVSFPEAQTEDENADVSSMLSGFSAVIKMDSDAATESSSMELSVLASGVSLATLSITGGYGEGAEIPDLTNLGTVYAVDNEEEMTEYVKNADWSVITENMKTAGVPADLTDGFLQILESSVEETSTEDAAA